MSEASSAETRPEGEERDPEDRAALPVSVVIPAHNRESMIGEALESVRAQTRRAAEIVVVDDGSTDDTAAVAAAYGAKVVRQPNRGVSAARNTGIRQATESWIAFLDSDDRWRPEKLEAQWRALRECPGSEMVFTDMEKVNGQGETVVASFLSAHPSYESVSRHTGLDGIACCEHESLATAFLRGNFINPSTLLVPRRLLLEAGLFDTTFGHCEDREFCLRLLRLAKAAVVERPLVIYRVHEGGASRNRLKMALGASIVADRVLAAPERYPPGAADYYREDQPSRLLEAAILCMEAGRTRQARRCVRRSLERRITLRGLVIGAVVLLGHRGFLFLQRAKRRLGLPGLR